MGMAPAFHRDFNALDKFIAIQEQKVYTLAGRQARLDGADPAGPAGHPKQHDRGRRAVGAASSSRLVAPTPFAAGAQALPQAICEVAHASGIGWRPNHGRTRIAPINMIPAQPQTDADRGTDTASVGVPANLSKS
jgi:hypothetical protein